ncbi:hypothetical protein BC833DRAFT_580511 [Globomyces pollinis-pini]|nr:hypothetical protein BC833DRAFT_580511 [Globomyces pollinis-pini]
MSNDSVKHKEPSVETKNMNINRDILADNTMASFVKYLKENNCKNIIVMTGAGISTSAGIPDFRTPGTGLYDNLQKYNLPYPQAIFDIEYFKRKPEPFFELSRELFPGKFKPTPCHHFIKLLEDQKWLLRNYTQNIDMLERLAKISDSKLVEAHGSFHKARCVGKLKRLELKPILLTDVDDLSQIVNKLTITGNIPESEDKEKIKDDPKPDEEITKEKEYTSDSDSDDDYEYIEGCNQVYTIDEFKALINQQTIAECDKCAGYIKPDIVFFGEQLPKLFHTLTPRDFAKCDALIVMGTSLQVAPFCNLISLVDDKVPRLLINREKCGVHEYGFDFTGNQQRFRRDAVFLGSCDEGVIEFCKLMAWNDELQSLINGYE